MGAYTTFPCPMAAMPSGLIHAPSRIVTKDNTQILYTIPISTSPLSSDTSSLAGSFPITTASAFRYSLTAQRLVFSAYVYPDGLVETVKE